jgi:LysM domain
MFSPSQDPHWMKRARWLTQVLLLSGALNVGLIATFAYFVMKEKQEALTIDFKLLKSVRSEPSLTYVHVLRSYSLLPYQELLLRLDGSEHVEEGMNRRDLALACLVAFHHFNLDQALGAQPLQQRKIFFEEREISVFVGLTDAQFGAILHYAKAEKWPLTSQGLFCELKRSSPPYDPSLLDAFYLSFEYSAAHALLSKTGLLLSGEEIVDLLVEGEWKTLSELALQQRVVLDLTVERRRVFLMQYLGCFSKRAAKLFLDADRDFISRRFGDGQILALFDLSAEETPAFAEFAKELLASSRTDAVRRRAAEFLYRFAGDVLPEPYDHALAVSRFLPLERVEPLVVQTRAVMQPLAPSAKSKKRLHTVESGDNLWKIARKYQVSVEEIMRINRMDTERVRPGKQLEIPEKGEKRG